MEKRFEKVWNLFNQRASVRSFLDKEVLDEEIDFLLQCVSTAPSSGNMQPAEFIIIKDDEPKRKIVESTYFGYHSKGGEYQSWIFDAPVVFVACANEKRTKARYGEAGKPWAVIDTSAAIENLIVAASGIGLASCWVGGFDETKVKKELDIPEFVKPVGLIPVGYPKEKTNRKSRLRKEIICYENYYNG